MRRRNSGILKIFWMLFTTSNNLDFTASRFNLLLRSLAELVCFNSQSFVEIAIREDLDPILKLSDQASLTESFQIHNGTSFKQILQVAQINQDINLPVQGSKAALGQTTLKGHLSTFKAWLNTATTASILALMTFAGGLTGTGASSATDAFSIFC
jgi:hypothetical protein